MYEVEDLVQFCLDHLVTIENAIEFLKTSYLINKKEVFDLVSIIFLQASTSTYKSMEKTPIFALWMLKETIMSSFQKYWYRFLMRKE